MYPAAAALFSCIAMVISGMVAMVSSQVSEGSLADMPLHSALRYISWLFGFLSLTFAAASVVLLTLAAFQVLAGGAQ